MVWDCLPSRPGTNISASIPNARPNDNVVFDRWEIELHVENDEVRKLIYDVFQPDSKHPSDASYDTFCLPAQGISDLPISFFINAAKSTRSAAKNGPNLCASDERDMKGFHMPETTKFVRKGQELFWPSLQARVSSAEDYEFRTADDRKAAFTVEDDDRVEEKRQQEVTILHKQIAALKQQQKLMHRPLREGGGDVGKTGLAYFTEDDHWVHIRITSFLRASDRQKVGATRGMYRFHFDVRDEGGKLKPLNDNGVLETDFDDASVDDGTVLVQDDEECWVTIDE